MSLGLKGLKQTVITTCALSKKGFVCGVGGREREKRNFAQMFAYVVYLNISLNYTCDPCNIE